MDVALVSEILFHACVYSTIPAPYYSTKLREITGVLFPKTPWPNENDSFDERLLRRIECPLGLEVKRELQKVKT